MRLFQTKSLLASVAFVLVGSTAFALTPRTGEYTCRRLVDQTYTCLNIIKDRFVDKWASGACDRYEDVNETLQCMRIIVGGWFNTKAVVSCDRFPQSPTTNACLREIKNCEFTDAAVRECDAIPDIGGTLGCFRYYCKR